ncbi:BrnA antitoxin family protein [Caballeronia sp. LZ001]|uniref:BrnA antitoxin family protein n=1 Tax=Caballeronia sp. LZ001 TaxID=3038553 RepID=UPI00285AD89A|nr:BrnA antitoxin family protein [Caballeronia sp. LZ001]MDR5800595.1 BrnA antitoxin family protein [Caballeronia sp. LZ001]
MNASKRTTHPEWIDPDDAPELTDDFFEQADLYRGDELIKRGRGPGRPPGSNKSVTTVRLDDDLLEALRSSGPRWQTRLNALVREWLKTHKLEELNV